MQYISVIWDRNIDIFAIYFSIWARKKKYKFLNNFASVTVGQKGGGKDTLKSEDRGGGMAEESIIYTLARPGAGQPGV